MIKQKMKTIYFFILIFWIGSIVNFYHRGENNMEAILATSLEDNEREITQLLNVAFAYTNSIKEQLSSNLNSSDSVHPLLSQLRDYPELNAFGLEGDETINSVPYDSNLTGMGLLSELPKDVINEINGALKLNLSTPIDSESHQFLWSYYMSHSGFLLLTPRVSIHDFRLEEYVYDKPFWGIALPENNPSGETVISDLYDDAGGQGLMISISAPVYHDQVFKGMVGLDVGLDYLTNVLHSGAISLDESLSIVTKAGKGVANKANGDFTQSTLDVGEIESNYKLVACAGGYCIKSNLIKQKFYAVYNISRVDLVTLVVKNIYAQVLILTLFILVVLLMFKLTGILLRTKSIAKQDGLSQLYNRMTLESLSNEIFESKRKNDEPICVVMADIDHFKDLNDSFGHHAGDKGIVHVASIIKDSVRKNDIVGRYGGEEFVVTMPNTDLERAEVFSERIRKQVKNTKFDGDKSVTVSIGIAECGGVDIHTFQEACKKADLALYKAKLDGRNRSVSYGTEIESCFSSSPELPQKRSNVVRL